MFLPSVRRNEEVRTFYSTGPHLESSCNCWCVLFSFINRKAGKVAIEPQIVARDTVKLWGAFLKNILLLAPVSRAGRKMCCHLKGSVKAQVFKRVLPPVQRGWIFKSVQCMRAPTVF